MRAAAAQAAVPIVTDENVAQHWRAAVDAALLSAGKEPQWLVLPPGEATKSWDGLARTVEWLLEQEVERKDHVIALGGGVIGDLVGFASSMLKRGCGFIQLPTSLLDTLGDDVTDAPLALVLTRHRADPSEVVRADPEPMLVRGFTVGGPLTLRLQGTARFNRLIARCRSSRHLPKIAKATG